MASGEEGENKSHRNFRKTYFDVLGICCPSEVPLIEDILKSLDGVKEFSVIVPSRTVIVVHDSLIVSQLQIVRALNQARLEANVRVSGDASFRKKWPSPFVMVSGVLLAFSFLKYVYSPLRWLAVAAVAAGIFPIASKSVASIIRFRIDINILSILAVVGTMAMKDYTEAATIVFLFSIAEWLETRASHKASAVMLSLMSLAPQKAIIAESGEEVEVDEVRLNTVLAVKAGETVPVDGIVMDGNCEVDEKTLTGEPFPVPKQIGSTVWAGTINLDGYIKVKTTALAADSMVAKMAKLVEDAQNSKTKTQRFIDKCSQYYTPAVVVVAACFAGIPAALKVPNLEHWFHLALVVLVSACPCGLILSTPVATFCALAKAATSGLLIKGGDYLETLARIKIAAFDKTGTITRGEFFVLDFKSLSQEISLDNLLFWVSSIESKSSHPMASALVDYAKLFSVDPNPDSVEDYQNFPGEGVYGRINGRDVFIGNKRIALRAGCQAVPKLEVDMNGGKTVGYIYVGERLVGMFNVSDACRSGVAQAIKELKSLGLKVAMLTGDNQAAAMHAQEQLGNGLDIVHAELLPENKAKIIDEFKKEGVTAMVGDGINDAPALATADIGISMGVSGSALATETGNIILMSNDIRKIPTAVKLARKAHRKVIENIFLSITIKGGILATAFAGYPLVSVAVLGDVGTCLLVILNSMLLLREKYKPADKCYRNSVSASNAPKFASSDTEDLEAGLLQKTCKSNCCQATENILNAKPAFMDVTKLDCCGEWQNDQGKARSQCLKPAELEKCQDLKDNRSGKLGCCENKNQEVEKNIMRKKSCEKISDLERSLQMRSTGNCKSDCCGKKDQAVETISTQSSITQPTGMQEKKNDGSCRSGCCKKKEQAKEEKLAGIEEHTANESNGNINFGRRGDKNKGKGKAFTESADLGQSTETNIKSCKSGCCKQKEKELADLEPQTQGEVNRNCTSGYCSKKQQVKEDVLKKSGCVSKDYVKQITHSERVAAMNVGQGKGTNNVESCKSGCCKQKQKESVVVEARLQEKVNRSCNTGCCSKNQQAKEDVTEGSGCKGRSQKANKDVMEQIACSEKVADMNTGDDVNCKSNCCRNNEQVKETVLNLDIGLQIENNSGNCEGSCCDEEGCETKDDKCRGLEECGSECMVPKRSYHGGCCRHFHKECCRSRRVGAAAGYGGLTQIVIE